MINGCRSADSVGISPHSRRHARGGRGQIPRVHGDLGTGMDPPDTRRWSGGCHARCLHHPGPHPARSHRLAAKTVANTHTSWPIDLPAFSLSDERNCPTLGARGVKPRGSREPASLLVDYLVGASRARGTFMVARAGRRLHHPTMSLRDTRAFDGFAVICRRQAPGD